MRVEREIFSGIGADYHPIEHLSIVPEGAWRDIQTNFAVEPWHDVATLSDSIDRVVADTHQYVARESKVMRGVPCIRGTRIPIYQICGMVAEGMTIRKVSKSLGISEEHAKAALRFASKLLEL